MILKLVVSPLRKKPRN